MTLFVNKSPSLESSNESLFSSFLNLATNGYLLYHRISVDPPPIYSSLIIKIVQILVCDVRQTMYERQVMLEMMMVGGW